MFYKNINSGEYYWYAGGKYHYIQSPLTLKGLFKDATGYAMSFSHLSQIVSDQSQIGGDLTPNNGLIRDTNDGKIYFLRDNYIQHIQDPYTIGQYHFNPDIIRNVAGISGLWNCGSFPSVIIIALGTKKSHLA